MNQTKIKSALVAICLAFSIAASAQTTVTHTVERGETVESIAKKYNVTPQDIINANPDAAEFVFAGMKLEIPKNSGNIKAPYMSYNFPNSVRLAFRNNTSLMLV